MNEPTEPLTGAQLKRAALARLRYERAMGIERVRRVATPPAVAVVQRPAPAAPAPTPPMPEPAPRPATPVASGASAGVDLLTPPITPGQPVADKAARWAAVEKAALACTKCRLSEKRTKVVFGCGDRQAKLLFCGEGPGADEDLQGLPFVGKAGQLLNKIIAAMELKREDVYICNTVKCRPPDNRTPLPDEIATCWPYLAEQIELAAPKVIVALGSPAAKTLLKTDEGIMSLRGRWFSYRGIPLMPTYHPAFVLRQYTEKVRRAVWEDMKLVMAKLKEA
jgi:DNA polymerase